MLHWTPWNSLYWYFMDSLCYSLVDVLDHALRSLPSDVVVSRNNHQPHLAGDGQDLMEALHGETEGVEA